jgi:MFS transporter, DHA1 family, chloramphenicol resistance protein
MPLAVFILGLAVFAQGTSEFMLSGLLPAISADLHVSIAQAGLLTSAFAIGMVVGAPVLAAATLRWPRRRALGLFLLVFAAAHVVAALTPDYGALLAARIVSALANAGFWAVAAAAAVAMVPVEVRARALAIVVGGVTLATVAGVPLGALVGQLWGWRAAFWGVAALSALSAVAVFAALPADADQAGRAAPGAGFPSGPGRSVSSTARRPSAVAELRALADPRLAATYLLNAFVQGATFCTYTFLAPLATEEAGFGPGAVPVLLVLFGVGSLIGITAGGRLADAHPVRILWYGATALIAGWIVIALTAGSGPALVVLILIQGMLAFGLAPALTSRAYALAAGAPTLAGAFGTAAFNVGAAAGPGLGGLAIDGGLGYRSPVWVSVALMALALLTLAWSRRLDRRAVTAGPAGGQGRLPGGREPEAAGGVGTGDRNGDPP